MGTVSRSPKVYVTKAALISMVNDVLQFPDIETAWGLWGIVMEDHQSAIVTHVLKPVAEDIERWYAAVKVGGDGQVHALQWLSMNEVALEKYLKRKIRGYTAFLFDGHSHHQISFHEYSDTDKRSIVDAVKVDGLEVAIGPLALLTDPGNWEFSKGQGYVVIDEHTSVKLMFYYYSKAMLDAGIEEPILITPKIIEANSAPVLPPLGWEFTSDADFFEQIRHLIHYGAKVDVAYREVKSGPPYEIVFTITKPTWKGTLVVVTSWNYPDIPPEFHVIPIDGKQATQQSNYPDEALKTGPLWNPGEDFIEAVFRLEARGEL